MVSLIVSFVLAALISLEQRENRVKGSITMAPSVAVYLEEGAKRTFAAALDWPGWCRQGPNETDALTALLVYAPRYASILAGPRLGFVAPKDLDQLVVVERLPGTSTTDFGAPSVAPTVDHERSCDAGMEARTTLGWP